ncbi:hypothetical protein Ndes2526B_g02522 [Nannochloris sp. 'desiccata']
MSNNLGLRGALANLVGFKGRQNILAWVVAGSLAYYFYIRPEQEKAQEQEYARRIAEAAQEQALREKS